MKIRSEFAQTQKGHAVHRNVIHERELLRGRRLRS